MLICELCLASFGSYEILEYSTISVSENLKPRDFEKLVLPVAYFQRCEEASGVVAAQGLVFVAKGEIYSR